MSIILAFYLLFKRLDEFGGMGPVVGNYRLIHDQLIFGSQRAVVFAAAIGIADVDILDAPGLQLFIGGVVLMDIG